MLWAGRHGGVELGGVDRSVANTIALPLQHAAAAAAVVEHALALGMGVALPGQAWLNQLPAAERGPGFAALPYALRAPLDPDTTRLSDTAVRAYAEAFVEAQLLAGASLVTTPAHVVGSAAGRAQDVALAHAAVETWFERQGWHPPPARPFDPPRALFATLAVRGSQAAATAAELVDEYAELPVEGYWLVVLNGGSSSRQLAGIARLALGLQERTDRPVAVNGVAGVHAALLASGVAAVCAGPEPLRPAFPPVVDAEDDIPIYHPSILTTIPLGAGYEAVRNRLFALQPCACGHHVAERPPASREAVRAHNTACLTNEARDVTFMAPVIDEQRLAARVQRADRVRRSLGLSDLPQGWTAVARTAQALRAGEDLAEDA